MLWVTSADLLNMYNIDLPSFLGVKGLANNTTVVEEWMKERHEEIFDYVAEHAYGGESAAERIFRNPRNRSALVRAICLQCKYIFETHGATDMGGILYKQNGYDELDMAKRLAANISPRADQILRNAGLLSGRRK